MKKVIIIDMGHGNNTPGKCSPDRTFFEFRFNRTVGVKLGKMLTQAGYKVLYTWEGDKEPLYQELPLLYKAQLNACLAYRYRKVNEYCKQFGTKNCLCVSIHSNAAANSGWQSARGTCVMVGRNASDASKKFAKAVYEQALAQGFKGNRCVPSEHYWVQALAMCEKTNCPAILTENLFYDNKEDLAILKSEEGVNKIVKMHFDGIVNYCNSL